MSSLEVIKGQRVKRWKGYGKRCHAYSFEDRRKSQRQKGLKIDHSNSPLSLNFEIFGFGPPKNPKSLFFEKCLINPKIFEIFKKPLHMLYNWPSHMYMPKIKFLAKYLVPELS